MSWNSFWQSLITHLLAIALGIVIDHFWIKTCPEPEIINLTEQQKVQIVQDARLGYISLDSAKTLIQQESKIKWIVKDSLIIKDSLNIKDSVITVYVPVYEAEDSLITLLDSLNYLIEVGLKQRFFPLQERFASSLWLNRLELPVFEESLSERTPERLELSVGLGTRFTESFLSGRISYYPVNSKYFGIKASLVGEYNKEGKVSPVVNTELEIKF